MDFGGPLDAQATEFHEANPHVMQGIVELFQRYVERQSDVVWGMRAAFEVLRFQWAMRTNDAYSDFKLNNSYTSWYARMMITLYPELEPHVEIRNSKYRDGRPDGAYEQAPLFGRNV